MSSKSYLLPVCQQKMNLFLSRYKNCQLCLERNTEEAFLKSYMELMNKL